MTKEFVTIREAAKLGLLSEYRMRILRAQNKLPGVQSGQRFLVNIPLLREQLNEVSRANASGVMAPQNASNLEAR